MELEYSKTVTLPDDLDSPRKLMFESLEDDYSEEDLEEFFQRMLDDNLSGERNPVKDMVVAILNQAYDNPEIIEILRDR